MLPPIDPEHARTPSEAMAAKRPPRHFSHPGSDVSPTMTAEPVPIARGTLIGDYRVERRLDEGGMGTVYAAVHPIIDKRVAIKVLHPHVARQEEAVARFIQEARAVNAIGHPGIVDIFGFGRFVDGRHYITMEYLEGQQLLAFLNETGPIVPVEMLPVARQLAESLAAAHDKGVVHRDMKPENVFLSVTAGNYKEQPWPPRTKILDFGLAKLIEAEFDDAAPRTRSGVTVGTPYYMSPEQCRGKALDRRADVYSLGVMMYEMITGRVPFYAAESVDVLYMHLTQAPEPPSRHRPVHPDVEALILTCMAKSAEERPGSMQEVVGELDRILRELSPDAAARDRDPVELQAEASAFFGGVDDGLDAAETEPVRITHARPTVPSLPIDLRQAALGTREGASITGWPPEPNGKGSQGTGSPLSQTGSGPADETRPSLGSIPGPARAAPASTSEALSPAAPAAATAPGPPSLLAPLPDVPSPVASTPVHLARPSLPSPAAFVEKAAPPGDAPPLARAPEEARPHAASDPTPIAPTPLVKTGQGDLIDPAGAEAATPAQDTRARSQGRPRGPGTSNALAQGSRGQPTEPTIPLAMHQGSLPASSRAYLLWIVVGLQFAAILVLLALLLSRS